MRAHIQVSKGNKPKLMVGVDLKCTGRNERPGSSIVLQCKEVRGEGVWVFLGQWYDVGPPI